MKTGKLGILGVLALGAGCAVEVRPRLVSPDFPVRVTDHWTDLVLGPPELLRPAGELIGSSGTSFFHYLYKVSDPNLRLWIVQALKCELGRRGIRVVEPEEGVTRPLLRVRVRGPQGHTRAAFLGLSIRLEREGLCLLDFEVERRGDAQTMSLSIQAACEDALQRALRAALLAVGPEIEEALRAR